ncbi:hypothetical protein D3C87_1889400 [compost metagenome]
MAIIVTKQGKKPELKEYVGTCRKCKTEVEFQQHDGVVTHDQRDGDFITVTCPTCSNLIYGTAK